ncbi:DUF3885 domain-containing protein [Peribacillus loiseleuriae]|uniref:DUF3885 domain-containing protein n=1 Tax=Peribacillus loiseleuriae TaxID=1679170 RepID=A0A0K9GY64_9BACI|nr:DUF3885 domain-containing protein [Peribacillus loiseleuriae]KMY51598.1 hypothetical protein AC625_20305 [Peribacillus loiseleuriae]
MIKILNSFLDNDFEGLILRPSLFYSWINSIRFEISHPRIPHYEKENLEQTFQRAITLFNKVFGEKDEILFVTDVHSTSNDLFLQRKPLNVYLKYIKDQQRLYKLQYQLLPSVFEDEDAQFVTHHFVLPCKKNEIKYAPLLKAISYEDFAHPSTILKNNPQSGYDIYFVNLSKKIIFHLYDDRGCDVLAADKETIRFLYEECNDWILDYDREEIDLLFREKIISMLN